MTRMQCKRRWEVEALEDGRLVDKDRTSLERHSEGCQECARALAQLRALGTLLSDLPVPERTELERRRGRADLLTRANERLMGGERRVRRWMVLALVPALLAIALAVIAFTRPPPRPLAVAHLTPPTRAPVFEVADVEHADFTRERSDTISRVVLRSGTASFHVEHLKPGARFLVALPDGEVEVKGTRFVVEVAGGHTRSVVVTEGIVAVRVEAFDGVLHAGERWPKRDLPASSAAPSASIVVAPAPARPLPGPRFAEAMGAFNSGDYGEAERRFTAFVREFPSDARAEDAMFLIADGRARRGDAAGARGAARAYLQSFPNGLRAPAAMRLAGETPSQ